METPGAFALLTLLLSFHNTTSNSVCQDKTTNCNFYKPYCQDPAYKDYLKNECPKTCEWCTVCEDKLTYCDYYKEICDDPKHDQRMRKYCAKTCNKCWFPTTVPPMTYPRATINPGTTCGIKPAIRPSIVGGAQASAGDWPWQVTYSYGSFEHWCGGSLVAPRWIVTAAHCFTKGTDVNDYNITLGQHDLNNKDGHEQSIPIKKIIIHPKYARYRNFDYDVALIKLDYAVTYTRRVKPICLIDDDVQFPAGTLCYITGWGALSEGGSQAQILQQAKVPIIERSRCQAAYDDLSYTISDRMICAGYAGGKIDACQGDSGGPMVCEKNGVWHLTGAVSWGIGCARKYRYGVYTNIKKVKPWIHYMVNNE